MTAEHGFDAGEPETVRLPSQEEIEAARAPRISDRAARTLAVLRSFTLSSIRRSMAERISHADDDRQLEDLDDVIRACGRDPETIGRLL